jgi:N6-adenosine-specific RNA methylase IME4
MPAAVVSDMACSPFQIQCCTDFTGIDPIIPPLSRTIVFGTNLDSESPRPTLDESAQWQHQQRSNQAAMLIKRRGPLVISKPPYRRFIMAKIGNHQCSNAFLSIHPDMAIMPRMTEVEFETLKQNIAANGQIDPIKMHESQIIDGRERYRACLELGIKPRMVGVKLDMTPRQYVVSQNYHRRHLSPSQKAMVAAQLSTSKVGSNKSSTYEVKQAEAAAICGVSPDSLQRAKKVLDFGNPSLIQVVSSGLLDVANASILVKEERFVAEDFSCLSKEGLLQKAQASAKRQAAAKSAPKKAMANALRELNQELVPTGEQYSVIYADPPWDHLSESDTKYPLMSTKEICEMRTEEMAEEDAVLFIWTTAGRLFDALEVIEAWGFEFKTSMVWDKDKAGTGVYFRVQHEFLLLATRGKPPAVPNTCCPSSIHREMRTEHSVKPKAFYSMIEGMYPGLDKLELFARDAQQGWAVWGNQAKQQPVEAEAPMNLVKVPAAKVVAKARKAANDGKVQAAA